MGDTNRSREENNGWPTSKLRRELFPPLQGQSHEQQTKDTLLWIQQQLEQQELQFNSRYVRVVPSQQLS